MWEDITRRNWERFRELDEIFAVVDARLECTYKRLCELGDIVWDRRYYMLMVLVEEGMGKADVGDTDSGKP